MKMTLTETWPFYLRVTFSNVAFVVFCVQMYLSVKNNNEHFVIGSCPVVNNYLKSPGYPNNYPSDIECTYLITIPQGKTLNISFSDFDLEEQEFCR